MATHTGTGRDLAWDAIEQERRLDRWVRRICGAAWVVTFVLTAGYAVLVAAEVLRTWRLARVGAAPGTDVLTAAKPLVVALGLLAVLIATLSTVGIFLRFRTAAFGEIQLRLAALETMLGSDRLSTGNPTLDEKG